MGRLSLCSLVLSMFAAAAVHAEPVATIESNGPSSNRIDIVFLGDGYTSGQIAKYGSDVATFSERFLGETPFRQYRRYFNLHRVDIVSAESGADHPSTSTYKDTALGAFYDCSGITRLICVDWSAVSDVLGRSVSFDQRDIVIVLVNDPQYGGSGGAFAVSSIHPDGYDVVLHEVGHSFGLLADEYDYSPPPCNNGFEPIEPNVTIQTSRASIKWRHWIDPSTPVPTTTVTPFTPGLYRGGKYCTSGMYRPTFNSKMRSLFQPFEQINVEQLVKRLYNFVSPIDDYAPAQSVVTTQGQVVFTVEPIATGGHSLDVRWELDGELISTANQVSVDTRTLSDGDHTLHAIVSDATGFVRNDPDQLLREARSWTIRVSNSGGTTTLPSGWTSADIGSVGPAGAARESGGTFTVSGAGADIWNSADQFHYASRSMTGDGTIVARVAAISGSEPWTKMGVMIRATASPSSQHAFMLVSTGRNLAFQRRVLAGGPSTHTAGPTGTAPYWVRLQRAGNVFTASASPDGVTWTTVGREAIVMPATVLVGLAASSHTSSALATGTFDHVGITTGTPPTIPAGWSNRDIGAVGRAGSANESGGTFTLKAAGADIWNSADAFHYAYRTRTGDGTIVARVATMTGADPWTKMGVMIRASTSPGAQHAFMLVSAARNLAFQRRVTTGGASTHTAGPAGTAPRWVRLQRTGDVFTASASSDGATWTVVGSDTIAMPATALWGLAGTSHTTSALASGTFGNVSIGP